MNTTTTKNYSDEKNTVKKAFDHSDVDMFAQDL